MQRDRLVIPDVNKMTSFSGQASWARSVSHDVNKVTSFRGQARWGKITSPEVVFLVVCNPPVSGLDRSMHIYLGSRSLTAHS